MKKFFYSAFLLVASAAFVTSCQKEIQPVVQQSLESKLSQDESFAKLVSAAGQLGSFSSEVLSSDDAAQIAGILAKQDKASASELAFVAEKLGTSPQEFTLQLTNFVVAFNDLEKTYSLSKMSSAEINTLVEGAVNLNPELKRQFIAANGKASVGAGICNLVVNLASLIGGGALCTAINVSTIPVIGGVLCTALLGVAKSVLGGLCNLIP